MPDGGVVAVEPPLVRPDPPELDHEGRGAEEEDGERVGEDGGEGGQPRHVPGHGAECRHNKHRAISGDSSDVGYGGQGAEIRNCSYVHKMDRESISIPTLDFIIYLIFISTFNLLIHHMKY